MVHAKTLRALPQEAGAAAEAFQAQFPDHRRDAARLGAAIADELAERRIRAEAQRAQAEQRSRARAQVLRVSTAVYNESPEPYIYVET